jgi:hypothetical protein
VAKKDSTARIYLKYTGAGTGLSNVPVRLHIFANNVEYIVNASGKAKPVLGQANADDAVNIWFNVNFSNDVLVTFYAEVDPNHSIAETNETNNRYPTSGTVPLTYRKRDTMKIVGQRLRYHPSGYGGTQYAGGWAVTGGGADGMSKSAHPQQRHQLRRQERLSGLDNVARLRGRAARADLQPEYDLDPGKCLCVVVWRRYTGARHVYGWAPSQGYSGGHADMPSIRTRGGLGVVGIGSDAPGTNTDNPARAR